MLDMFGQVINVQVFQYFCKSADSQKCQFDQNMRMPTHLPVYKNIITKPPVHLYTITSQCRLDRQTQLQYFLGSETVKWAKLLIIQCCA